MCDKKIWIIYFVALIVIPIDIMKKIHLYYLTISSSS